MRNVCLYLGDSSLCPELTKILNILSLEYDWIVVFYFDGPPGIVVGLERLSNPRLRPFSLKIKPVLESIQEGLPKYFDGASLDRAKCLVDIFLKQIP